MARQLTAWNKAVQKQFKAGKAMDVNYSFKQALLDASKMHTSGGNKDGTDPDGTDPDGTDPDKTVDPAKYPPLNQKGGSEPVGTPVGGSDLVGTPLNASSPSITPTLKHTTGGRRSKKNKSKLHKKKKGGKSHKSRKSHKKPKHH